MGYLGVAFEHPSLLAISEKFEQRMEAIRQRELKPLECRGTYSCECTACANCETPGQYEPPAPPQFDSQHSSIHGSQLHPLPPLEPRLGYDDRDGNYPLLRTLLGALLIVAPWVAFMICWKVFN